MSDSIELSINGKLKRFVKGATIASLLDELSVDAKQVAVEVNLELVPRESHVSHELHPGDLIEVHTLVGGG